MGYFYASEKRKFEASFAKFRAEALAAGMEEENIQKMYELDLHQFNRDRAYYTRRQSLSGGRFSDGDAANDDRSPLMEKYQEKLSTPPAELFTGDPLGWLETLEDARLLGLDKLLSAEDLDILSYIAADGLSQAEISRKLGLSRTAICKRLARIRKTLQKHHPAG